MKNIVVFNASGAQGNAITNALEARGYQILTPVRSEKKDRPPLKGLSYHTTDFSSASLQPIIAQADAVVLTFSAMMDPDEMLTYWEQALQAIKAAGSPRTIAYLSSIVPQAETGLRNPDARLAMKNRVGQVLPDATILSGTLYLENFSQALREAVLQYQIIPQAIPAEVPVAYISTEELALYILAALENDAVKGQFIPLGGALALQGEALAAYFSQQLEKPIQYKPISPEALIQFLIPVVGEEVAKNIAEMYAWEATDSKALLTPDVQAAQQKLGVTPIDIRTWLKQAFA